MRLFVTGGAGFIGSCFVRSWLQAHPQDTVVTLDLLTYAGSRARLAEAEQTGRCRFVHGDICDLRGVQEAMHGCEAVVHFAAETHVDRSITNAMPFVTTNVQGTQTVLQAAADLGVTRVVHISSDEVYGPILHGAVDEGAPLAPRSPYAASKAAADLLAQAYRETFGLPVIIVRPTNIFGPWQLPEKFIPLCITNACDGHPVPIYGDGQQRRAWLFVQDACEALSLIVAQGASGELYNLAGGHEQANLETALMIVQRLGASERLLQGVPDRPGHDRRYAMTDQKVRGLGWRPATPFAQGLAQTIAWYQAHQEWWRPLAQRLREDPYHWLNRAAGPGAHQPSRALR